MRPRSVAGDNIDDSHHQSSSSSPSKHRKGHSGPTSHTFSPRNLACGKIDLANEKIILVVGKIILVGGEIDLAGLISAKSLSNWLILSQN